MRDNGGENSPLPEDHEGKMPAAMSAQYQLAPTRLKQLDLQYRNVILALITSPGRKNHYAEIAGNSGERLFMRRAPHLARAPRSQGRNS